MILAVTGHRPPKLGGYTTKAHERLISLATTELQEIKPDLVITGMALGWDQAIAQAAINLQIPFDAYIPCDGQSNAWPSESKNTHIFLLAEARKVVNVSPGLYSVWKMHARNKAMVDACDKLLALYDGSPGGTANCVNYAIEKEKPIINCWNSFLWREIPQKIALPDTVEIQLKRNIARKSE